MSASEPAEQNGKRCSIFRKKYLFYSIEKLYIHFNKVIVNSQKAEITFPAWKDSVLGIQKYVVSQNHTFIIY